MEFRQERIERVSREAIISQLEKLAEKLETAKLLGKTQPIKLKLGNEEFTVRNIIVKEGPLITTLDNAELTIWHGNMEVGRDYVEVITSGRTITYNPKTKPLLVLRTDKLTGETDAFVVKPR